MANQRDGTTTAGPASLGMWFATVQSGNETGVDSGGGTGCVGCAATGGGGKNGDRGVDESGGVFEFAEIGSGEDVGSSNTACGGNISTLNGPKLSTKTSSFAVFH